MVTVAHKVFQSHPRLIMGIENMDIETNYFSKAQQSTIIFFTQGWEKGVEGVKN